MPKKGLDRQNWDLGGFRRLFLTLSAVLYQQYTRIATSMHLKASLFAQEKSKDRNSFDREEGRRVGDDCGRVSRVKAGSRRGAPRHHFSKEADADLSAAVG